ncbi:MAG: hypothetical protein ACE5JX_20330 [Acidobacteriota bacterium]
MSEVLESLFRCRPVKAFAKQFKELEKEWGEPAEFVGQAAEYLGPRLYQPFYDEDTPHSLFGLGAAVEAAPLFPQDREWWPFVQQAWHAANERRRHPLPWAGITAAGSGSLDERWRACEEALDAGSFEAAFGLARGLLEQDSDQLGSRLLQRSLYDSGQGGLGFLFVTQYLELAARLEGDSALGILAAIIHLMAYGPRECELATAAAQFGGQEGRLAASGELDETAYHTLEQEILFGDALPDALQAAADALSAVGLEAYWDGLLLAGINAVCNARAGHWTRPARAFLLSYLCRRRFASADPPPQRKAALYAAALTHQAAIRSRYSKVNRDLEEVARELCPMDPFNTLRSLVSHSDPFASATAVYAILGMGVEKHQELYQSLATLAAKNDGRMGRGYDLLVVKAAVDSYQKSKLHNRDRFLSGCAFFLGRLPKDYQLLGAYGV